MAKFALQVVAPPPEFDRVVELQEGVPFESGSGAHSLHSASRFVSSLEPSVARWLLDKYSLPEGTICDPFCASGATVLEACLLGRSVYFADFHPIAILGTLAKIRPADLTELTLALQCIPLSRPVGTDGYFSHFSNFYDLETFRELVNLKEHLAVEGGRIARFVEVLALELLHGRTAASFSVYSPSHISFSPAEQERLNVERRQMPDYRAVLPRLLKKGAGVLRDGLPSILSRFGAASRGELADARDLSFIANDSVDCVVTELPLQRFRYELQSQWLEMWLLGLRQNELLAWYPEEDGSAPDWQQYLNGVLLELARVTACGGRACLAIPSHGSLLSAQEAESVLRAQVEEHLYRFWEFEGAYSFVLRENKILSGHRTHNRASTSQSRALHDQRVRVLVLRRS